MVGGDTMATAAHGNDDDDDDDDWDGAAFRFWLHAAPLAADIRFTALFFGDSKLSTGTAKRNGFSRPLSYGLGLSSSEGIVRHDCLSVVPCLHHQPTKLIDVDDTPLLSVST